MITYDEVATNEDRRFKRACFAHIPKWLREEVVEQCKEAFQAAYANETCQIKRDNAAKRAANFIMLKVATEYGMTNWREWHQQKQRELPVKIGHANSPYLKPRTSNYQGPSILEMAEQQRKRA